MSRHFFKKNIQIANKLNVISYQEMWVRLQYLLHWSGKDFNDKVTFEYRIERGEGTNQSC